MINKIDLHTHSNQSDGTLSPAELAKLAKEKDISAVALTDHDTVSGVEEFISSCDNIGIEGIPGVEISAKFDVEMHILGLFLDYKNDELISKLNYLKNARQKRNEKMFKRLKEYGFCITEDDIVKQKGGGDLANVGRAHMARALVEKGYIQNVQEGFDRYLGKDKCCYVGRETYSVKDSISMIKNANGLAVLAHPIYITRNENQLRDLLEELKGYGLDGVESYYSEYPKTYMETCLKLAKELGLLPTGGSDFHALNKPHIQLGTVCGDMYVPYDVLENLKKLV